ncbi:sulfite exporter TauE/SafE family protein [candidate division KSB1 bacterium]|nr:sulfite exporter TauE/SafE family protein [candidate division KSB1 bacterium]
MIQDLFSTLSTALSQSLWLALVSAFIWGVLSILLSPCHLSSIPLVIGFVMRQEKKTTARAFIFSLIFSVGILVSIALIGLITASLGRLMGDLGRVGNLFVVAVFFIVGLYLLDVIRLDWSFAPRASRQQGWISALLLGLAFGVALGPCTFAFIAPVLGVAFAKAQSSFTAAVLLILFFALGHCGVIVFFGTLAKKAQDYLNRTSENTGVLWAKRACGILVMAGGIYLLLQSI